MKPTDRVEVCRVARAGITRLKERILEDRSELVRVAHATGDALGTGRHKLIEAEAGLNLVLASCEHDDALLAALEHSLRRAQVLR